VNNFIFPDCQEIDFKSMSPDVHHYISQQSEKLKIIRDEVQENATKAGESNQLFVEC
jgi:hypothetical protein